MTPPAALVRMGTRVRQQLEAVYGSPRGECYRWSNYVACELRETPPHPPVWLVLGVLKIKDAKCPHVWVESGGWFIDITADQFAHLAGTPLPPVWILPSQPTQSSRKSTALHLPHRRRRIRG